MSYIPTDEEIVLAAPKHTREDGTINSTTLSREFDATRSLIQRRLARLAREGRLGTSPVLPGFAITQTSTQRDDNGELEREWIKTRPEAGEEFEIPKGHTVKGVSALVGPDGREIAKWIKTREGERDPQEIVEIIKREFEGFKPAAPVSPMPRIEVCRDGEGYLTLLALPDLHLGMYAWGREAGENWDLKIAERVIGGAMERVAARTMPSEEVVVLSGGDAMHADNNSNTTAKSGNVLQVDGRYDKVLGVACRLHVKQIDIALQKHGKVRVRILKGNHDEHASVAIAYFLSAYYRSDPRVTVDLDPSLFWFHQFGKVMLSATHGHAAKPEKMPAIMAHRQAEMWGATKFRFAHTFHIHHHEKRATELDGVIIESHQAPIPQDTWHSGEGFLSGRSLQSIVYAKDAGEVARSRVVITN